MTPERFAFFRLVTSSSLPESDLVHTVRKFTFDPELARPRHLKMTAKFGFRENDITVFASRVVIFLIVVAYSAVAAADTGTTATTATAAVVVVRAFAVATLHSFLCRLLHLLCFRQSRLRALVHFVDEATPGSVRTKSSLPKSATFFRSIIPPPISLAQFVFAVSKLTQISIGARS